MSDEVEVNVRSLSQSLDRLLDEDIQQAYEKRGRVDSSALADELEKLPRYDSILKLLAPALAKAKFRERVQDRLHKAVLDKSPEQMTLISGWEPLRLPGALCVSSRDGATLYVRRGDALRADYHEAKRLLRKQIRHDSDRLKVLNLHDRRVEALREKYGDLPERELVRLAAEGAESSKSKPREARA
jgi:hypothetical protein